MWEFVSFVEGPYDKEDIDTSKVIMFLVRHVKTEHVKFAMIKVDPWKVVDKEEPFDLPETIFVMDGFVAEPKRKDRVNEFSPDKIRSVQILQKKQA